MTKSILEGSYKIGKFFGENGVFDEEMLAEYSKPETIGTGFLAKIKARICVFMGNRSFWKPRLEKNGVLQKHGDRPYLRSPD